MGFPQEIGIQDDKMKVDSDFDTSSTTNDEFTICHNRMGFPQEIGTQHDK